jgi:hypothetical protein
VRPAVEVIVKTNVLLSGDGDRLGLCHVVAQPRGFLCSPTTAQRQHLAAVRRIFKSFIALSSQMGVIYEYARRNGGKPGAARP